MVDIRFSDELSKAFGLITGCQRLPKSMPVVALESTIITHGMPFPQNLDVARRVEAIVRENGAIPATIAVLKGVLHIGLNDDLLVQLSQTSEAMKLSRADFAYALSFGKTGSTTVAATMLAAHLCGISVFATGGIGGVHRGAELSFDISADLNELARTPVTVVSAGIKAILDIPKTLEVLETNGIPVIVIGQDQFPAFWARQSGSSAPMRAETAHEVAHHISLRASLGNMGGHLIANPIPQQDEIPMTTMDPLICKALEEGQHQGITGKAVTPFLLRRIFELTDGASLKANIALIENNARLAAQITVEFQKLTVNT